MKIAMLADLHLKTENPICRLDNYFNTGLRKFKWVKDMMGDDSIILVAGDIFDTGKPQSYLKMYNAMASLFTGNVLTIAGNHDISYRTMAYMNETAYGAMSAITGMHLDGPRILDDEYEVHPFNFSEEIEHRTPVFGRKMIAMTHQFVYDKKPPFDIGKDGRDLLKEFPEYAVILSGDNHQHFILERDGRYLVNPGSLLRMDADQIDYKPQLIIFENGKFSFMDVPIEDVVSRQHIEIKEASVLARENMIAYLELAKTADSETYDFLSLLLERTKGIEDEPTKAVLMDLYTELKDGQ